LAALFTYVRRFLLSPHKWDTLSKLSTEVGGGKKIFFIEDRLKTLEEVAERYARP
jgi:hypothetical protein